MAGKNKRIDWDFRAAKSLLDKLNPARRQTAEAFIAYFEAKISLDELKKRFRQD